MITCKTNNPNHLQTDEYYDFSTIESFYWDAALGGASDSVEYDCDYADCDHDQCDTIDLFKIKRIDVLLFSELEDIALLYIWKDTQGFINTALIDNPNPMPVYALGL